jgi:general secretion pathway protein H
LDQARASVQARLDQLLALAGEVRGRLQELAALEEQNRRAQARIEDLEADRDRLLAALSHAGESVSSLRDELSRSQAQLAAAATARAEAEARLEEQARAVAAERARAQRQLAASGERLRERERELEQMASLRFEAVDLRQRLDAAEAELKRERLENGGLGAQLAAARIAAAFAAAMAEDNLAAIEDQIAVFHAAAGSVPPVVAGGGHPREGGPPEPRLGLVPATLVDALPAMPHPEPPLPAAEIAAWTPASNPAEGGAHALAEAPAAVEDGWIPAELLDAALNRWEPASFAAGTAAPGGPEPRDVTSAAALAPAQLAPLGLAPHGDRPDGASGRGSSRPLAEAAARLADGLRATRAAAMSDGQERVFTVDVARRAFAASSIEAAVTLDPTLEIQLVTARSELVDESRGRIRFFPDGSSTGGRIDLEFLGERTAVNVGWRNGMVTVER